MEKEQLYVCEKCDYSTSRKFNYLKHIETDKHKSPLHVMSKEMSIFHPPPPAASPPTYRCPNCDRKYMAQRSLWRHSKRCSSEHDEKSVYNIFSAKIAELCHSNAELSKTNQIQQTQMIQLCTAVLTSIGQNLAVLPSQTQSAPLLNTPNNNNLTVNGNMTNNSNNKTFNINMFLNEECKDAMNMTDFVKTIELDTDDMEDVGKRGFVKGISKIFIDTLKNTDIHKRPIHCTDRKREVLYVREDDKWEREDINSQTMINAVKRVGHKNVLILNEWAKQNPECEKSCTRANDVYMKLSRGVLDGDDDNITKVVKNIAKETVIERNNLVE